MPKRSKHKNYPIISPDCLLVYTLKCNITGEIFYIGSTGFPAIRLSGHYGKYGRDITMEELEVIKCKECNPHIGYALQSERFWVCMFLSWGFKLKNKYYTNNIITRKAA